MVLESVFAVLVGITCFAKYASDVTKTLTVLTVALAVMVASVAGLSLMDQDRLVGATTALSLLMATFSLVVASTHLAKKAQGVLVVLTLVVGSVGRHLNGHVAVRYAIRNTKRKCDCHSSHIIVRIAPDPQ